jgi:hypothetical protein
VGAATGAFVGAAVGSPVVPEAWASSVGAGAAVAVGSVPAAGGATVGCGVEVAEDPQDTRKPKSNATAMRERAAGFLI